MSETADPRAALAHKQLSVRAAATRDLSATGTPDDIPTLVVHAATDKSPAVRLGAAAAVADILSRHRVGPRAAALDTAARQHLLGLFRAVDPSVNPGLFPMLGTLQLPEATARLFAGLRDPRGDVRVGAAVGLLRHVVSAAAGADPTLTPALIAALGDRRLKPDAQAELARVAAAAGCVDALPALDALHPPGLAGELVASMAVALRASATRPVGVWHSDGRDAGEIDPTPPLGPATLVVGPSGDLLLLDGPRLSALPVTGAHRCLWYRPVGQPEPARAVQAALRTFHAAPEDALSDAIEAWADPAALPFGPGPRPAGAAALRAAVLALSPDPRLHGLLAVADGDLPAAVAHFRAATDARRPAADAWALLGEALRATGEASAARAAFALAVEKGKKKHWSTERARARLAEG